MIPRLPAVLILASALLSPEAQATNPVPELLLKWHQLSGEVGFSQQKTLQGLPFPIHSSGYLQFAPEQLLWHTQTPIDNQILINAQGINEINQDKIQTIAGTELIGRLMLAVLQKDTVFLEDFFQFSPQHESCLTLTPVKAPVNQFFSRIILCGEQQLQTVELTELSGNQTHIQLQPVEDTEQKP